MSLALQQTSLIKSMLLGFIEAGDIALRDLKIKIGNAPDYVITMGKIAIMHQVAIDVTEFTRHSREVISHASLFTLMSLARSFIHAKYPQAQFLRDSKYLATCACLPPGIAMTCEIKWNQAINQSLRNELARSYSGYLFSQ
jgi:hypothetical protein